MALKKQFLVYGSRGHRASLNLMLMFYFSFCFYYCHAKNHPVTISIIQETNILYTIYITKIKQAF